MTCTGTPRPAAIPADWQEWTGWSCECSLYGPGTAGTPYADLAWEPCELPYKSSVVCERHVQPQHANEFYAVGALPVMRRDAATGEPLLQATHALEVGASDKVFFHFVANARTGKMRHVLAQPSTKDCGDGFFGKGQFIPGGMSKDEYILYHPDANEQKGQEGWVRVPFDQPWPSLVVKKPFVSTELNSAWRLSDLGVLRTHIQNDLFDRDGQGEQLAYGAVLDQDGMPSFYPLMTDEAIFFPVGGLVQSGMWAWSKATGPQPILRWFGDSTRGAGNLGTDGKDMVWVYGEGKKAGSEDPYPSLSVMTAPYSLEPAAVAKTTRRLRSQPGFIDQWRYQVGCGYAARSVAVDDGKTFNGLFIVRLSDGVSWTLPGAPNVSDLAWSHTLSVDCEHVYMALSNAKKTRIGRVRLDSLGPGTPPD
ncbi:MAG: hypothetical protein EOO72_00735 [Myxococcaceae bacterium]|nr:MAG: hypothetical protein EOO72_00735 [Myxococcaceae bacterium]